MQFQWPLNVKEISKRTIITNHDTVYSGMFSDKALIALLDNYPREKMGIYTFPEHGEGNLKALHGCPPALNGADLLKAVRTQRIWLNLRAVNRHFSEYDDYATAFFNSMEAATGVRTF